VWINLLWGLGPYLVTWLIFSDWWGQTRASTKAPDDLGEDA
jgi:hypothetical protein